MTGEELRVEMQALVADATIGAGQELRWINHAYDFLVATEPWNFARKEDESQVIATNTLAYSLPTDFLFPSDSKFFIIDAQGNVRSTVRLVPMKKRRQYNNSSSHAYIDVRTSELKFTAEDMQEYNGMTISFPYQHQPDQLTESTSPIFNRAFHKLLAFEAAKLFWYNEQQEKSRSFNREMQAEYNFMRRGMKRWDNLLDSQLNNDVQPDSSWAPQIS